MKTLSAAALLTLGLSVATLAGCELGPMGPGDAGYGEMAGALLETGDPAFSLSISKAPASVALGQSLRVEALLSPVFADDALASDSTWSCEPDGDYTFKGTIRGVSYRDDAGNWVPLANAGYSKWATLSPAVVEVSPVFVPRGNSVNWPVWTDFTCTKVGVFHVEFALDIAYTEACTVPGTDELRFESKSAHRGVATELIECIAAKTTTTTPKASTKPVSGTPSTPSGSDGAALD